MNKPIYQAESELYEKAIKGSKRIRWEIDKDVLRGREFDFTKKFLPDGISDIDRLGFLDRQEKQLLSQVQGRTYANMFGFVERFIVAKILDLTRDHWLGSQVALEALVRFCDEELKHQVLFQRIEKMMHGGMPVGYKFLPNPNEVASAVLQKSTWAVMALIYEIELFTQEHYKQSIAPDGNLSELYKDVFLFHWKEEANHAYLDALEWARIDKPLSTEERDRAVDEAIELVGAVDGILRAQSEADAGYFLKNCGRSLAEEEIELLKKVLFQAYRRQYIFSGVEHPRFQALLGGMITKTQGERMNGALKPLMEEEEY